MLCIVKQWKHSWRKTGKQWKKLFGMEIETHKKLKIAIHKIKTTPALYKSP